MACERCGGQWLSESALATHLAEAGMEMPALHHRRPEATPRRCPYCDSALAPLSLAGVAVGQCGDHGLWLDAGELEAIERRAGGGEETHAEHSRFWSALEELIWFGR